jgi:hypothetical protein
MDARSIIIKVSSKHHAQREPKHQCRKPSAKAAAPKASTCSLAKAGRSTRSGAKAAKIQATPNDQTPGLFSG